MRNGTDEVRLVAVVCLSVTALSGCLEDTALESGRFSEGAPPPVIDVEPGPLPADEALCDVSGSPTCDVLSGEAPEETWESYCDRLESGFEPSCGDCLGWGECEDLGDPPSEEEWADEEDDPYGDGDADADGDADDAYDPYGDGDADGDADDFYDPYGDGDADGDAGGAEDDPWDESDWTDQDCDDWYGGDGGWCAECWACCWSFDCAPEPGE